MKLKRFQNEVNKPDIVKPADESAQPGQKAGK